MNLYSLADALGRWMGEPPLPRVEYVERCVNKPNLEMLTPVERRWLEEAQEDEK